MRTNCLVSITLVTILSCSLTAEDTIPKKTLAIVYEEGKTPEALFHSALGYFKKAIETGELKSAELGTAKIFGEVIDIQTATDSTTASKYERDVAAILVKNAIETANIPYSGRFSILPTNLIFGDKSLGYVINPYRGCYDHDYLAKGLEKNGYQIVSSNEHPDIIMTIGIDACMSENEFKEYVLKNTSLKLKKANISASNSASNYSLGDDLIRSGSSMQLATPSGGGNAGMAVAGVGLGLNMVNWMMTKAPQERDMIRYHVKFEGKDKEPMEFYPILFTKNTHKEGDPVQLSAKNEAENVLYSTFIAWSIEDKALSDKLPPLLLEKDLLKMTEMMVNLKK